MAHTSDYWKKRQDALMAGLDKKDEKFTIQLQKEYDRVLKDLEKDIAYYYQSYGVNDVIEYRTMMGALSDSEREAVFRDFDNFVQQNPQYVNLLPVRNNIYNLNRLEGLQMSVRMKMAQLGIIEDQQMTDYLSKSYEYGYMATMKNLENTSSFFSINNSMLQQTLSNKWFDKKNYSDRLWENKNTLRNWFNSDLSNGLINGTNYNDLVKSLQNRIDVGKFYAKRLVWTESAFFMNTANAHAFIDDGIENYRYTSIIDNRTSDTCRALNNKVFSFKDYKPGLNAPPMHSFCRSTVVPIENDVKVDVFSEDIEKTIDDYGADVSYAKYADLLGINNMPTFEDFKTMGYNDSNELQWFKDYAKSREKNNISALSSFSDYVYYKKQIEKRLIGQTTVDGIQINGQRKHFIERVLGTSEDPKTGKPRNGVSIDDVVQAVKHGTVKPSLYDGTVNRYIGKKAKVTLNIVTGDLIQVAPS
ncbi:minor capsid protein [Enterococcus sp. AZ103]|uniref:minor capsid protein n=1 Tax=Enterococcus sp. AZ103 TaxID=2774628 RepID=UPI003F247688